MTAPATQFRCLGPDPLDPVTGTVAFSFALATEADTIAFCETVRFPLPDVIDPIRLEVFTRVMNLLSVVMGVSYFKAGAPPVVDLGRIPLTASGRAWATDVYRHGLREFAYVNDLPQVLETRFTGGVVATPAPSIGSGSAPLVPCGGGKDSIVSLEAVAQAGLKPVGFAVNPNSIIRNVMGASGLALFEARRTIDRTILELNEAGAYNGHVPVTAINSLIAVGTSVLHGLGPVVMSNEASASAPNLDWHGQPVNHQWSKSLSAERGLSDALADAGLTDFYFSLLRHLNEVQIARLFAQMPKYDSVFTSCNNAFVFSRDGSAGWCGNCPKCRFVYLALAPFAGRERLVQIFGTDLLADSSQTDGYRELLGLGSYKPFECVGEIEESHAVVSHLAHSDEWRDSPVVVALTQDIARERPASDTLEHVLTWRGPSLAPADYLAAIDALG